MQNYFSKTSIFSVLDNEQRNSKIKVNIIMIKREEGFRV